MSRAKKFIKRIQNFWKLITPFIKWGIKEYKELKKELKGL